MRSLRRVVRARVHAIRRERELGASSVEFIILFPIVLLVFFGAVQTAVTYIAGNAAQAAANAAYSQARTLNGTTESALSAGYELLEGRGDITGTEITVQRTATEVTVTVTGQSLSLVPGFFGSDIERTAYGPVERWID